MVGALPQGSTSSSEQQGIQASKVRLVADCCVCQHASGNPSRALAALQIDIQDFSLVQAIRSCVVDGANLLALGNEQGLQVLYLGGPMCAAGTVDRLFQCTTSAYAALGCCCRCWMLHRTTCCTCGSCPGRRCPPRTMQTLLAACASTWRQTALCSFVPAAAAAPSRCGQAVC